MIEETLLEAGDKMDKAVEVAKEDFASIRTGRATPGLYNKVIVEYYGTPTPLQQLPRSEALGPHRWRSAASPHVRATQRCERVTS